MSQILSLRVPDQMAERLERFARRQGNGMTRTRASLLLLEEALRESEFAYIEYRDSAVGRQAYVKGTGLTVWEMVLIARSYDFDAEHLARQYHYPLEVVQAALHFYAAYQDEINQAIDDNDIGPDAMKRLLPQLKVFTMPQQETEKGSLS